jgi:DNA-3-methyladenine glycosylase I
MVAYHDTEWGVPVDDDSELFERLCLEGFQAGLSWSTILRKRETFRIAFRGFDPAIVAAFGPLDRERLLADPGIVRNRAKVDATIANAGRFRELVAEAGSFAAYLTALVPEPVRAVAAGTTLYDLPPRTEASDRLSKDLRRRGFGFVGSTIMYAFMQSVGLVDDHLPDCFRYRGDASDDGSLPASGSRQSSAGMRPRIWPCGHGRNVRPDARP